MYLPLHLRLTFFYALVLALALWFFGSTMYTQAEKRAYQDLDNALKSRAESVRLGKDIFALPSLQPQLSLPVILPSVDGLGTGGIAIEVLDNTLHLLATTTGQLPAGTMISDLQNSPVPWDAVAARKALASRQGGASDAYSTITYQEQPIRVYTLINEDLGMQHIIQTARSELPIQQSLNDLRFLLWSGGALVMVLALTGGWLISRGMLRAVQHVTQTTQAISASRDFSKRVPVANPSRRTRDELAVLAVTFNEMLANLEEAYQRQQRFVADASHELRAPITSIRCNLDLLAKAPDLPPNEVHAAIIDARAEAERMGRLVNDLLLLARADNLSTQTKPSISNDYKNSMSYTQEVDLDSLLLDVFRQYRHLEQEEGEQAGPRLLLHHTTPARVQGDADQLKQVLVALVDNALKYTPQEGYVSLALMVEDTYAFVKVNDTGIGILPEDLSHIFERFYRADRVRTRDRGGSGLGLAIVERIVQDHQGNIEVESTPGKGSTFTVKLPIAR
jgi:two-component system, OmpR family, sensor kinase